MIEGLLCEVLGPSRVKSKHWGGSLEVFFLLFFFHQMCEGKVGKERKKKREEVQEHPKTGQFNFQSYQGTIMVCNCVLFLFFFC